MPKETSAGAVIFRREGNQTYYLLLHYQSGHWDFPKGHIEEGENEITTVKREAEEETGLKDLQIIEGFKEHIKYFFKNTYDLPKGEKKKASCPHTITKAGNHLTTSIHRGASFGVGAWIFKMVVFYLAQTQEKEIKISFEHKGFKWLPYEEALKQLTFKNAKEILEKANDFIFGKSL